MLIKHKGKTDSKYGMYPEKRSTEELIHYGIVNINKPSGPTSHQVSAYIKQILHLQKAGHSGTLDPKVTGVLPIALDNATRIVQPLLTAGKEYVALMYVHQDIPQGKIYDVINTFIGKITQLPPIKSAVKRQERERTIYYLRIMEVDGKYVLFTVGCQAGTYVRKLIHDIGKKLGTGAHMAQLIRTKAGPFTEDTSVTLQDVKDAFYYYKAEKDDTLLRKVIQPIETAVTHLKHIQVLDSAVNTICHGASLNIPGISTYHEKIKVGDTIAIMTLKGEIIALGKALLTTKDITEKEKGTAVKTTKVFMKPNVYKLF
jgi:H/ACA ribonucleoprotein complex subunit 4